MASNNKASQLASLSQLGQACQTRLKISALTLLILLAVLLSTEVVVTA